MKGEAEEIKHLCDEDLVKEVEEVINDSTDPKYDGYRKMLNVKGEERSQLMNFIFSRTSPGTREVNTKCFAQLLRPRYGVVPKRHYGACPGPREDGLLWSDWTR